MHFVFEYLQEFRKQIRKILNLDPKSWVLSLLWFIFFRSDMWVVDGGLGEDSHELRHILMLLSL